MTQSQLAVFLSSSRTTIINYEVNRTVPDANTLRMMAWCLDVAVEDFYQ
jgi:DNA-binding XRE family transcriptional regulator